MTLDDRMLEAWLADAAPPPPADLAPAIMHAVATTRQRPSWRSWPSPAAWRQAPAWALRLSLVQVALLVLLTLAAVVAAGALVRLGKTPSIGTIVYSTLEAGADFRDQRVHLSDADGGNVVDLGAGRCPRFSPDGRHLVWDSLNGKEPALLRNLDGTVARSLGVVSGTRVLLSPNGRDIAILRSRAQTVVDGALDTMTDLWVTRIDAGTSLAAREADARWIPIAPLIEPVWSPDGDAIAYATAEARSSVRDGRRTGIHVVTSDGNGQIDRDLSQRPGSPYGFLEWSPDGRSLAYDAWTTEGLALEGQPTAIFATDLTTGAERALTDPVLAQIRGAWSPDGTTMAILIGDRLAFADVRNGSAPDHAFALPGYSISSISWSPDGRWLLATSRRWDSPVEDVWMGRELILLSRDQSELRVRSLPDGITCEPKWQPSPP